MEDHSFFHNETGYVVSLYQSPSWISNDFNSFSNNLEKPVANISSSNLRFILTIGDLNAKSSNRWSNDTTTAQGASNIVIWYKASYNWTN